jgi:hypothetical protein
MTTSEIKLSKAVVDELRALSSTDTERVLSFLEHLASNPYDRTVIGSANVKGDLFASSITDKLYVYWSFDVKGLMTKPKINILGLARKSATHGLVPLFSMMDEKLKPA